MAVSNHTLPLGDSGRRAVSTCPTVMMSRSMISARSPPSEPAQRGANFPPVVDKGCAETAQTPTARAPQKYTLATRRPAVDTGLTSMPVSVTTIVCSNWADRLPSWCSNNRQKTASQRNAVFNAHVQCIVCLLPSARASAGHQARRQRKVRTDVTAVQLSGQWSSFQTPAS